MKRSRPCATWTDFFLDLLRQIKDGPGFCVENEFETSQMRGPDERFQKVVCQRDLLHGLAVLASAGQRASASHDLLHLSLIHI